MSTTASIVAVAAGHVEVDGGTGNCPWLVGEETVPEEDAVALSSTALPLHSEIGKGVRGPWGRKIVANGRRKR